MTPHPHLHTLPPVRRARAEALLAAIDTDGSDTVAYSVLTLWLVKQRGDAHGWSPAQLDTALNDAAEAGAIVIKPSGHRSGLTIERVREVRGE